MSQNKKVNEMIDWNNAPEGATHYLSTEGSNDFWKETRGGFISYNGRDWNDTFCHLADVLHLLVKRPTDQPYMPKVGEECEYYHIMDHNPDLDGWKKCFVVGFIKDGKSLAFHSEETDELHLSMGSVRFRPIQTQEEKDREFHHSVIVAILEKNDVEINKACMNDIIDHIIKTTK